MTLQHRSDPIRQNPAQRAAAKVQPLNVGEKHCGVRRHRVQDTDAEGAGSDHGASQAMERAFIIWFQIAVRKQWEKKKKSTSLNVTLAVCEDGSVSSWGQDGVGGVMELEGKGWMDLNLRDILEVEPRGPVGCGQG